MPRCGLPPAHWARSTAPIDDLRHRTQARPLQVTLDRLALARGHPAVLRYDNGPELACKATAGERVGYGVRLAFIPSGEPWRNGYVESFNSLTRGCRAASRPMGLAAEGGADASSAVARRSGQDRGDARCCWSIGGRRTIVEHNCDDGHLSFSFVSFQINHGRDPRCICHPGQCSVQGRPALVGFLGGRWVGRMLGERSVEDQLSTADNVDVGPFEASSNLSRQ